MNFRLYLKTFYIVATINKIYKIATNFTHLQNIFWRYVGVKHFAIILKLLQEFYSTIMFSLKLRYLLEYFQRMKNACW